MPRLLQPAGPAASESTSRARPLVLPGTRHTGCQGRSHSPRAGVVVPRWLRARARASEGRVPRAHGLAAELARELERARAHAAFRSLAWPGSPPTASWPRLILRAGRPNIMYDHVPVKVQERAYLKQVARARESVLLFRFFVNHRWSIGHMVPVCRIRRVRTLYRRIVDVTVWRMQVPVDGNEPVIRFQVNCKFRHGYLKTDRSTTDQS